MSIRLNLEVEDDWEDDLEEFCRLKRLGRIKEAKEHFWSTLEHVSTIPYIRIQYAEMLQSSGDYKSLQSLAFLPEFPPNPEEESPGDRSRGKLVANYALLDVLSQRPIPNYLAAAWSVVRSTLKALAADTMVGSTEVRREQQQWTLVLPFLRLRLTLPSLQIQLLALCLRVLAYLKSCTHGSVVGPVKVYAKCLFNWRQLYHDLVGDGCIWDFRDLFMAAVSVFGWQETLVQFFDTTHLPRALNIIIKDWSRPLYDEAAVMGLLDLFTSLILHDHADGMKSRNTLLLHHARTLAESVEHNDAELMRSRPFVQWLLAKSVLELEAAPERPDGVRLEHFSGLQLDQGGGVHLPIYVPTRHTRKPDWDMFFSRSTPAQRRVIEVAIRAADEIGDYSLQAESIKLLILQSRDPKRWMSALEDLQLETQGDREGYLATCLSRYLITTDSGEEASLLQNLERPGSTGKTLYFEQCENASLAWAWSMVRILLTASHGEEGSVVTDDDGPSPFLDRGYTLDGSKLPPYVAEFARVELGIFVSPSMGPLSLDDPETQMNGDDEDVKGGQQLDRVLRNRFARRAADRRAGPEGANPWDPALFETWDWMPNYANNALPPGARLQADAAYFPREYVPPRNPWLFYSGQQQDPLAQGISPSLQVSGWPSTWYEDAKRSERSVSRGPKEISKDKPPAKSQHTVDDKQRQSAEVGGENPGRQGVGKDKKEATVKGGEGVEIISANSSEKIKRTETGGRGNSDGKPQMSVEDGAARLNFPGTLLDDNEVTVFLASRDDGSKFKAYNVTKDGVFETAAAGRIRRRGESLPGPGGSGGIDKLKFNMRTVVFRTDSPPRSESTVRPQPAGGGSSSSSNNNHNNNIREDKGKGKEEPEGALSPEPMTGDWAGIVRGSQKRDRERMRGPEPAITITMSGAADGGKQQEQQQQPQQHHASQEQEEEGGGFCSSGDTYADDAPMYSNDVPREEDDQKPEEGGTGKRIGIETDGEAEAEGEGGVKVDDGLSPSVPDPPSEDSPGLAEVPGMSGSDGKPASVVTVIVGRGREEG